MSAKFKKNDWYKSCHLEFKDLRANSVDSDEVAHDEPPYLDGSTLFAFSSVLISDA